MPADLEVELRRIRLEKWRIVYSIAGDERVIDVLAVRKRPPYESMSEFLEFPVRSREDWVRFRDSRLNPDDPRRLDGDWRDRCARWMANGWPIQLGYFPDSCFP